MSPPTFRELLVEELPDILPGAQQFIEELGDPYQLDKEAFLEIWRMSYDLGTGRVFVAEYEHVKIAAMGVTLAYDPLLSAHIAHEGFWFVLPQYRGTISGVKLFWHVERWAKRSGYRWMMMGCPTALPSHTAMHRILTRWGYHVLETMYRKEL